MFDKVNVFTTVFGGNQDLAFGPEKYDAIFSIRLDILQV